VVRNVVANALRFAPAGTAIEVGVALRDGLAITTVRDHGPGIPADELEAVFEPFVQSSRTRDGAGGTGLGLAICRRIMTALNGHVTADNHPDGGAVFSIAIKLLPQRPAPADAAALQAPSREHADLSKRVADLAELPI
jgi:signal transduction histidine kinase